MGGGKTTFMTFYARLFEQETRGKIYANYHLKNVSNFVYNPYLVIPISELEKNENSLILVDDIKTLNINIEHFLKIIASISRKASVDVVMTGQYYTMFPRELRMLSQYQVDCQIEKVNSYDNINPHSKIIKENNEISVLNVSMLDIQENEFMFQVHNLEKEVFPYFDTNEIVATPNERKIINEIIKFSHTLDDLESNLKSFFKKIKEYNNHLQKLLKLPKFSKALKELQKERSQALRNEKT